MKKNDVILIAILLILAILSYIVIKYFIMNNGAYVEVIINGETVETFDLSEDITYKIETKNGDYNLLVIKDNIATVTEASCPDKLCINQKDISKNGESIICLPNQVVVRIVDGKENTVDAIAN